MDILKLLEIKRNMNDVKQETKSITNKIILNCVYF